MTANRKGEVLSAVFMEAENNGVLPEAGRWRSAAVERTERLNLRPSVTSSGRILRNSRMQEMLVGSEPNVDMTEGSTSCQSVMRIASWARQMFSCVRISLRPLLYCLSRFRTESLNAVTASLGSWRRSYTICHASV